MAEPIQNTVCKNKIGKHQAICTVLNRIYEKKNHDYGDSFSNSVKTLGIIAAITRIYDKVQRVISLTKPGVVPRVSDETLIDTLMDAANYCILTIMELEGEYDDRNTESVRTARISTAYPDLPGEYIERSETESRGIHKE